MSASDPTFTYLPGALVTMRQFSPQSLLWQTISVQPSGHAQLTTLIGEIAGAVRKRFVLPAAQAAKVRQLVRAARTVAPPRPHDPQAQLYTLTLPGLPAESLQGTTPPALTALTGYLSGLMFNYCC